MRVYRIKSTKHSDLLMTGDHKGPSTIHIVTRLRPTQHGEFFRELLLKMAPEALKIVDSDLRAGTYGSPGNTARVVADGLVRFCETVAMAAMDTMQRNKALGVNVPSYETLLHKLTGSEISQPEDSDNVVSLSERQERDHE